MKALIHGILLPAALAVSLGAKSPLPGPPAEGASGVGVASWCDWFEDGPGDLYRDRKNPWIQSFEVGGRLHYQAAYLDGEDVNGREFHDTYSDFRRVRLEAELDFLEFFSAEVDFTVLEDDRFRDVPDSDLHWDLGPFTEATLEFDLGKAFGSGWLDGIKVAYGRSNLRMTHERHESSRRILTVERSSISDYLAGGPGRPTGLSVELDKGDFELNLAVFSGEDDSDFVGGWNDGEFYYAGLRWTPGKAWTIRWDQAWNDQAGSDDFLGYSWASALSVLYEEDRWGILGEAVHGENGGGGSEPDRDRRGSFRGLVVMPWVWIVEDRLQAVAQYQYASASRDEGFQVTSRYLDARHDDPFVDVDGGRGSRFESLYLGLNYHLCGDHLKLMGGVSFDQLEAKDGDVETVTYLVAVRTYF